MSKKSEATAAATAAVYSTDELNALSTTAAKIRFLAAQGLSRGQISKALGIRYQWVRNVLITPVKGR